VDEHRHSRYVRSAHRTMVDGILGETAA
jgi:hypothetical protein